MMIKDFIKEVKKTFGEDVEFKATSKEGKIFHITLGPVALEKNWCRKIFQQKNNT